MTALASAKFNAALSESCFSSTCFSTYRSQIHEFQHLGAPYFQIAVRLHSGAGRVWPSQPKSYVHAVPCPWLLWCHSGLWTGWTECVRGRRGHTAGLVLRSLYFIKPRIAVSAVGQYLTQTQLIEHTGPTLETLRISSLSRVQIRTRMFLVQVERAKLPLGQRVPRAYVAAAGQWPSVLSHWLLQYTGFQVRPTGAAQMTNYYAMIEKKYIFCEKRYIFSIISQLI